MEHDQSEADQERAERRELALAALAKGKTAKEAAFLAGVTRHRVLAWQRDPEFAAALAWRQEQERPSTLSGKLRRWLRKTWELVDAVFSSGDD